MKKLLGTLLLTMTAVASANSVKIYSTWDYTAEITPRFEINADLGRAWLEVEVDSCGMDPDCDSDEVRVKVEGLKFNTELKQIELTQNGETFVCADVRTRGRGIFRSTRLRETGNCTFNKVIEIKNVDDGFYIKRRKYQTIFLETK